MTKLVLDTVKVKIEMCTKPLNVIPYAKPYNIKLTLYTYTTTVTRFSTVGVINWTNGLKRSNVDKVSFSQNK